MARIIFIDDDLTNAGLVKMLLELEGFEVATCASMACARKEAAAGADAFIVDCNLAGRDSGLQMVREIRDGETVADAGTPIIATSGDYRLEQQALDAGANSFLLKPYPADDLARTLNQLLSKD